MRRIDKSQLIAASELALAGQWEAAHEVVQRDEEDPMAAWVHAVLHRIEGDMGNARYWYGMAGRAQDAFSDPQAELHAIIAALSK